MKTMRQALVGGLLLMLAMPAWAEPNSARQITLVAAFAPGGGVDAIARIVAEKLQDRLKQPVVVENRTGGGGILGIDTVAKAAPDGNTLLLLDTSAVLQKWLHKSVPFDVVNDFTPIANVAFTSLMLFANPAFKPNTARDVIAEAKANPGKLSAGTPGVGTPHHLAMTMMNAQAGIDIVHVPYRGTAPALNDLLGGQIPMIWATPIVVMPHVTSGKVKVIGTASGKRETAWPNVPTIAESGLPGFDVSIWFGIAAPVKTPASVTAPLSRELQAIVALPEVQERMAKLGFTPEYLDSGAFGTRVRNDHKRFGTIIQGAGIAAN